MKTLHLDFDAAQAILNYLSSRPYREVAGLIPAILAAPVVEGTAPVTSPKAAPAKASRQRPKPPAAKPASK